MTSKRSVRSLADPSPPATPFLFSGVSAEIGSMTVLIISLSWSLRYLFRQRCHQGFLWNMAGSGTHVELADRIDRHAQRQAHGRNGPDARAADIVEVVGQHEIVAPLEEFPQGALDLRQDLDRHQPAYAARIERQEFPRALLRQLLFYARMEVTGVPPCGSSFDCACG